MMPFDVPLARDFVQRTEGATQEAPKPQEF
jgi:hypothetical protein